MKRLVLLGCLMLAGCGESDVVKAIEASGYTNVRLTGTAFWGCSESDDIFWSHKFEASAVTGKTVDGIACGAMLKGYTIRIMNVK